MNMWKKKFVSYLRKLYERISMRCNIVILQVHIEEKGRKKKKSNKIFFRISNATTRTTCTYTVLLFVKNVSFYIFWLILFTIHPNKQHPFASTPTVSNSLQSHLSSPLLPQLPHLSSFLFNTLPIILTDSWNVHCNKLASKTRDLNYCWRNVGVSIPLCLFVHSREYYSQRSPFPE